MQASQEQEAREPSYTDRISTDLKDYRNLCDWLNENYPRILREWIRDGRK